MTFWSRNTLRTNFFLPEFAAGLRDVCSLTIDVLMPETTVDKDNRFELA